MGLSFSEVRERAQNHPHLRADPLYARLVMRRISPLVTWLLVTRTSITANGVTYLSIASGVGASVLVAVSQWWSFLLAVLMLQLAYLLDTVDGEVARVRGASSLRGTYLDLVGHGLQNQSLYGAAAYVLIVRSDAAGWALAVGLLGVAFSLPFGYYSWLAVRARTSTLPAGAVEVGHARAERPPRPRGASAVATAMWTYRRVSFLWEYPASMNLFSLALLADVVVLAGGHEPLALPVLVACFLVTLLVKQVLNAVRLLGDFSTT